ncbi:pyridoxal kinase PdxY [Nigerium massiliense]|uniref:pyridoxal kinase PdxY n=1 Tax=Nigerium massiliense TaxID=1522317 RepID=UPI0005914B4D|nr:pyridoxal kinase PdxY [Nigerium massiliense]
MTTILSIQSTVAYGHVGNSAVTFPLMRLGVEVWPVITVHFSNNTSYDQWTGPMLRPEDVYDVVAGLDALGVLGEVDAVLTGYQGAPEMGSQILRIAELVKQRAPEAVWCCDPVMGDVGLGMYVLPGIPEFMRDEVVPASQIITPNHYELNFLAGRETSTVEDIVDAAQALRASGPETVLVTSALVDGAPEDELSLIAVDGEGAWRVRTPRMNYYYTGSGDLTSAMFLHHWLRSRSLPEALGRTADVVYSVLEKTKELGRRELALVQGQDLLANPTAHFEVMPI